MLGTEPNRDEEIRQIAYKLWQDAGCPEGSDVQNWLNAETIWLEQHRAPSGAKPAKAAKPRKPRKPRATNREL
jgi:hypothetical protein